jgi:hypothetical protein
VAGSIVVAAAVRPQRSHLQAELCRNGHDSTVVVAATLGGVADAPGEGESVGGFVQERGEHRAWTAVEALAGDENLRSLAPVGEAPPPGGEVTELAQRTAIATSSDQHDHLRNLSMVTSDGRPGTFQCLEQSLHRSDGTRGSERWKSVKGSAVRS